VGFESAVKRRMKDLQRTGSDLRRRKCMKNPKGGFQQGFNSANRYIKGQKGVV
jgi:hypothetical protein